MLRDYYGYYAQQPRTHGSQQGQQGGDRPITALPIHLASYTPSLDLSIDLPQWPTVLLCMHTEVDKFINARAKN